MTYLDTFMINHPLDEEYFGKWVARISDWRLSNPDLHQKHLEDHDAGKKKEKERRRQQKENARGILRDFELKTQRVVTSEQSKTDDTTMDSEAEEQGAVATTSAMAEVEEQPKEQSKQSTGSNPEQVQRDPNQVPANESDEEIDSRLSDLSFDRVKQFVERRGNAKKKLEKKDTKKPEENPKRATRSSSLSAKP